MLNVVCLTRCFSSSIQAKNNFDPSVGVIDTSKWSSSNPNPGKSGNGSPGFLNHQSMGGGLGPMNPGNKMNPNMNGLTNPGTPGSEWPTGSMFNNSSRVTKFNQNLI